MARRLRVLFVAVVCGVTVWHAAGCALLNPGGQVAQALSQQKVYEWGENGSFRVEGVGPQTERFLMLQGDIRMTVDADGNEVVDWENSRIAYYLRADPSADDAASTANSAFELSVRQFEALAEVIKAVVDRGP